MRFLVLEQRLANTTAEQATWNIINVLPYIGLENIPVYKGVERPLSDVEPLLDGAFRDTGFSNAKLEKYCKSPENLSVQAWFEDVLVNTHTQFN